jgi:hypothetical protein
MANHKRKKSKRQVKCTLCTQYRWLGNSKERMKAKYRKVKEDSMT